MPKQFRALKDFPDRTAPGGQRRRDETWEIADDTLAGRFLRAGLVELVEPKRGTERVRKYRQTTRPSSSKKKTEKKKKLVSGNGRKAETKADKPDLADKADTPELEDKGTP